MVAASYPREARSATYESIKGRNAPGSRAQRCGPTANVEVNMRILHREFSQPELCGAKSLQFWRLLAVGGCRLRITMCSAYYKLIGIGAAVTRRPLPHHRAYGSVHGGSSWLRRHFLEQ